jgi:hypothetical protein
MTPVSVVACLGGWCRIREACRHYRAADRREPAERLCAPGRDGHPKPSLRVDGLHRVIALQLAGGAAS